MRKINKIIKFALLLSAINLCGHVGSLAMEKETVATEGGQIKQLVPYNAFLDAKDECSFNGFPDEIIMQILSYFDHKSDQNSLLALMGSCKTFQGFGNRKYEMVNILEHHYSWQENPSLSPSALYSFNTRMLRILGLYSNISYSMNDENDEVRFNNLCNQFLSSPFFSKISIPVAYVSFLQCDVSHDLPTFEEFPDLEKQAQTCLNDLVLITNQYPTFQNERAIFLHFCHFTRYISSEEVETIIATAPYEILDSSLMRILDKELLTLKQTPGLSIEPQFAETWGKIIDLEPFVTTTQLFRSISAFGRAAETVANFSERAAYFLRAAVYFDKSLELMIATGQKPKESFFAAGAETYSCAALYSVNKDIMVANYIKASEYMESHLEGKIDSGEKLTAQDFIDAAEHYHKIGLITTDATIKDASLNNAVKYYELALTQDIDEQVARKVREKLAMLSGHFAKAA